MTDPHNPHHNRGAFIWEGHQFYCYFDTQKKITQHIYKYKKSVMSFNLYKKRYILFLKQGTETELLSYKIKKITLSIPDL